MGALKPTVTIKRVKDKWMVDPSPVNVDEGQQVEFSSQDSDAKISFPDSVFKNSNDCWETISKGQNITKTVESPVVKRKYYYAVMCKHENDEYSYAEGNTCPSMIVGP